MGALIIGGLSLGASILGRILGNKAQNDQKKAQDAANAKLAADTLESATESHAVGSQQLVSRIAQVQAQSAQLQQTNELNAARQIETTHTNFVGQRSAINTNLRRSIISQDRDARMNDGNARVSAGAAGVSGASVDALLADLSTQSAVNQIRTRTDAGVELNGITRQSQVDTDNVRSDLTLATSNNAINTNAALHDITLQQKQLDAELKGRINGVTNLPTVPGASSWATALQIGGDVLSYSQNLQNMRKPK